jgi:hypothetical protein
MLPRQSFEFSPSNLNPFETFGGETIPVPAASAASREVDGPE